MGSGPSPIDPIEALEARSGIVSVVGAGGKKTAMAAIAAHHPGRVALTATSRIPRFSLRGTAELLSFEGTPAPGDVLARLPADRVVAYAGAPARAERLEGLPAGLIAAVHEAGGFDVTCVKADGARNRFAKAHVEGEPTPVPGSATVLLLASVRVVGQPLDGRRIHRPEAFADLLGGTIGATVTADDLATVLADQLDLLAGLGMRRVIPVLNMVDDERLLAAARDVAHRVFARARPLRVVLAQMAAADPIREVVA